MPKPKVVDMRGSVAVHGNHKPVRIVIHDTESTGDVRQLPGWWRSSGLGSQYAVGSDGTIVQFANDTDITYHAGGINSGSIGIEIAGYAKWSRAEWERHPAQLRAVSALIGSLAKKYGIRVQLGSGIWTHGMVSKEHSASEGHWDPGPGFPLKDVLRAAAKGSGLELLPDTAGDAPELASGEPVSPASGEPIAEALVEVDDAGFAPQAPEAMLPEFSPPYSQTPDVALPQIRTAETLHGFRDYDLTRAWQQMAELPLASDETRQYAEWVLAANGLGGSRAAGQTPSLPRP